MARMFPATYPGAQNSADPEFAVFELLRRLPDTYSVIYSKKFKGGRRSKEEAEIDFLIFDGSRNLICLEVKGGEIAYSGPERAWYQNGERMNKAPDWQASSGSHAVIEFLGKDAEHVNINWALAFPHCSKPAGSGGIAEVPGELLLDATSLLDPIAAVERVCAYNETRLGRTGVTRYQASIILDRLLRSVGFVTKIGIRLLQDHSQLVKATEQQLEILEDLELNQKTAVMGYAGTGKTIIATEFAKRMSEAGQAVLLLFYNRMVANTVRFGLGRDSEIACTTFHSLARGEIESVDPDWWNGHKGMRGDEFWENEVPLKMLEVLENKAPRYHTIIIDEGQDFRADWIETLERLQIPDGGSRFVVLYDAKQDIFGRWGDVPWASSSFMRKQLRKNCRNTKAIINHLNQLVPSDMIPFEKSPEGAPVKVQTSGDKASQAEALRADLSQMLKEGIAPGNIVILIDSELNESSVARIEQIGKCKLSWMGRSYRSDSRDVQITTIESFKGLEADVVFVVLGEDSKRDTRPHKLYTQTSRARLLLHLYKFQ